MFVPSPARSIGRRALLPIALLVVLLGMVGSSSRLCAQSVWVQGGTSTLMSASGIQLDYRWAPVQGWLGAGIAAGSGVIGGYVSAPYHNLSIGLGDRYQPIGLETDIFDGGRYFAGRGLYVTAKDENQSFIAFAGATADERSYNFFHAFQTNKPTAGFFYSYKHARTSVSSFTIQQEKFTSIHSLQFAVTPDLKISLGGGMGYDSPYFSSGAQFQSIKFLVAASYSAMGNSFQRIGGVAANAPEHVGANVRFRYQPIHRFGIALSHENLFSPVLVNGLDPRKVSMDAASVFAVVNGFNLGASASTSKSGTLQARSQDFNISRDITRGVSASGALMRLNLTSGTSNILIGNVREKISPRLSLNEGISRQGNMNSLMFGGRFVSNRITFGVQHDMVYSTLAGGFGGSSSVHIWTFNVNAQLFRGISLHTDSMVDPTGKVRYTAWADGIGMGNPDSGSGRPTQAVPAFSKFVVKGIVQDTDGKPVWGMSVHVDGQSGYTDNAGRFFLRFRKGEQYPFVIIPEQSLNSQVYRVVRAPVSALAELEDQAQTIVVVVERDRHSMPPPRKKRSEIETPNAPIQGGGRQPDTNSPVPAIRAA